MELVARQLGGDQTPQPPVRAGWTAVDLDDQRDFNDLREWLYELHVGNRVLVPVASDRRRLRFAGGTVSADLKRLFVPDSPEEAAAAVDALMLRTAHTPRTVAIAISLNIAETVQRAQAGLLSVPFC